MQTTHFNTEYINVVFYSAIYDTRKKKKLSNQSHSL
jgi:hypothetical protein